MATIFETRQQQVAAATPQASREDVIARRVAARRRVLQAYNYVAPASAAASRGPYGDAAAPSGSEGGEVSGNTGTASSDPSSGFAPGFGNVAGAFGMAALADDDTVGAAREVTGLAVGMIGVTGIVGMGLQLGAGVAAQLGSPVGTVHSSFATDLMGYSMVNTQLGLAAVGTRDNPTAAYEVVNPEIAMAHRAVARASAGALGQSAPGTDVGDSRGSTEGLGQGAPGSSTGDTRGDTSGLGQAGPGGFGGESGGGDTGGGGGVGEGGGIGL